MDLPTYFSDFLSEIRLSSTILEACRTRHIALRDQLMNDEGLKPKLVDSFLQGSYRRKTIVQPQEGSHADVDVVVVTSISRSKFPDPQQAYSLFRPFMEKYYSGKFKYQGRSIGIHLDDVDLDLVITASPPLEEITKLSTVIASLDMENIELKSLSEPAWKISPLYIPDREAKIWKLTHPLAQIRWTWEKNNKCNGYYLGVVKALKWWRREKHPEPEHLTGYPLEHLIGYCCPDGIGSVADGVARTLEKIAIVGSVGKPVLPDHGVPEHDVFHRITVEEFRLFYSQVVAAAKIARKALDSQNVQESVTAWQSLFGKSFPDAPPSSNGGYTPRSGPTEIRGGRFA